MIYKLTSCGVIQLAGNQLRNYIYISHNDTPDHPVWSGELQRLLRKAFHIGEFHVDLGDRTPEEEVLRSKGNVLVQSLDALAFTFTLVVAARWL